MRHRRFVCLFATILAWLVTTVAIVWSAEPPPILEAVVGFDGLYKLGHWTPLVVQVETAADTSVRMVVVASDPDGNPNEQPGEIVHLRANTPQRVEGLFRCGRLGSDIEFRLVDNSGVVLVKQRLRPSVTSGTHVPFALGRFDRLWVTLGDPVGAAPEDVEQPESASVSERELPRRIRVARLTSPDQLPAQAIALDGIDALFVAGSYELGHDRAMAVMRWVQSGGHLVLSVGTQADAYQTSSLATYVSGGKAGELTAPVPIRGRTRIADLSGLESFVGGNERIRFRPVTGPRIDPAEGQRLVGGLDGPQLVRVPYGFGRITFLAVDLARGAPSPLVRWKAVTSLCRKLADAEPSSKQEDRHSERQRLVHRGITDLATQLHAAQEHFESIPPVATWTVMGLMFAYLCLIGPLDYLIVHRWLKRPRLTWVTFPLLVTLAAGLAMGEAVASKGRWFRLNQLELVDVDAAQQSARVTTWATLYSPESGRYRVDVRPNWSAWQKSANPDGGTAVILPRRVTWSGVPESAFGGMFRVGGIQLARPAYRHTENAESLVDLPVRIWSTNALVASSVCAWSEGTGGLVESALSARGPRQLSARLTLHLPGPVVDWFIAYDRHVFHPRHAELRTLQPGQTVTWNAPDPSRVEIQLLRRFLTGERRDSVPREDEMGPDVRISQEAYDPLSREPGYIVRMLTLHDAAGGTDYTGLQNSLLRSFDLSPLLTLDRALLFGRLDFTTADLAVHHHGNPDPRFDLTRKSTVAFIRIVLPVQRQDFKPKSLPKLRQ